MFFFFTFNTVFPEVQKKQHYRKTPSTKQNSIKVVFTVNTFMRTNAIMDYLHIFAGTYLLDFIFFQDNLVGTVVVISLLIWIPASCLISWIGKYKPMFSSK